MILSDRLDVLKERYRAYLEAERKILMGQSYSMGGLSLTRADLDTVRKVIADLEVQIMKLARESAGRRRSRIRYVVPADALHRYSMKSL